jgi:hypothetical protein
MEEIEDEIVNGAEQLMKTQNEIQEERMKGLRGAEKGSPQNDKKPQGKPQGQPGSRGRGRGGKY